MKLKKKLLQRLNKRMLYKLNKNHGMLGNTLTLFVMNFVSSVFTALFYFLVARMLGPEQYGILGSLLSLYFVVTVLTNVISITLIKYISHFRAKSQNEKIARLIKKSILYFLVSGFIFFLITALSSKTITYFIRIGSVIPVMLLGLLLGVYIVAWGFISVVNALEKFRILGLCSIINGVVSFVAGVVLVKLHLGVSGALIALVLGQLAMILFAYGSIKPFLKIKTDGIEKISVKDYFIPALAVPLCMGIMVNFHVFMVKYFFSAEQAGFFAAAVLVTNIIFSMSVIIVNASFPKICELHSNGKNPDSLLRSGLKYMMSISVGIVFALFAFPRFLQRVIFGPEYQIHGILGPLGAASVFLAVTNILLMYNVALKRFNIVYYCTAFPAVEILLLALMHSTLVQVSLLILFVNLAQFAFVVYYLKDELINLFRKKQRLDAEYPLEFYLQIKNRKY